MNEFNEKNRRVLRFCCTNLRSIGLLMLILGLVGGFALIIFKIVSKFGYWQIPENYKMVISLIPLSIFNIIFYGLAILLLVQFIRFLVEEDYKQGWILRHGDKLFYLYALYIILSVVITYATILSSLPMSSTRGIFMIIVSLLSITVRVIILISLGQILRRILPVIEESKTLV
jgi:hypothetical protein